MGLTACVAQPGGLGYGPMGAGGPALSAPAGRRVAVLLPLTGSNAALGQSLLRAARLAFAPGGDNAFDTQDTRGTFEGAAAATRAAAAAGAGIIVGPLTAAETTAVTPVALARNIPVLALTSDPSKAQRGIWPLGLTPGQQVRTLVRGAAADNKRRLGAILPSNPFGDLLARDLGPAAAEAGLPPPKILRYASQSALDGAIKEMGGAGGTDAPPSVDALLLGTSPDVTLRILPNLVAAGLGPERTRLLGTALWARDATRLGKLAGAWFAGPPAATLKVFEDNFKARYGTAPRDLASIAFDAAGAAHAATGPSGVDISVLLNPSGFAGANGMFRLLPDGTVRRSLELFEIGTGGVTPREAPPEPAGQRAM